jgi:sensor c-di-GMP phosphodiesterase-like protein
MLTDRATARVDGMNQKRAELEQRLESLATHTRMQPDETAAIALCRSKLEAQQLYAADITFVTGQVSELETAVRAEVSQPDKHWPRAATLALALALLAGLSLLVLLLARIKPATGGLARYQNAEAQLNRLLAQDLHD